MDRVIECIRVNRWDRAGIRGIRNPGVLEAMREVPREAFVPESMVASAYKDAPLAIGQRQTISQPYIVAVMTEMLEPSKGERVLEIGTGCGYAAAILSRIVKSVYTIERYQNFVDSAKERFCALQYGNIQVCCSKDIDRHARRLLQ
jgi:protein-L-isoaspartate(D-aspartate) O-methyltransferase